MDRLEGRSTEIQNAWEYERRLLCGCLTKLDKDGTQEIAAKFKGALKTVLAGMAQKMEV